MVVRALRVCRSCPPIICSMLPGSTTLTRPVRDTYVHGGHSFLHWLCPCVCPLQPPSAASERASDRHSNHCLIPRLGRLGTNADLSPHLSHFPCVKLRLVATDEEIVILGNLIACEQQRKLYPPFHCGSARRRGTVDGCTMVGSSSGPVRWSGKSNRALNKPATSWQMQG